LRVLIADAYGIPPARVQGGPEWIGAASADVRFIGGDRFDIQAQLPEAASGAQVPGMLRALLIERFRLRAHVEMRDAPVYVLLLARADGRPGEQLRRAAFDCEALDSARKPPLEANAGEPPRCANEIGGSLIGRGQRIGTLVRMLALFADRPVVDMTGLTGAFDFDLQFPGLNTPLGGRGGGPAPETGEALFTALREQLGLKLEPSRSPIEFLVVDAVERPTAN
jgi:uncharacterized protein (TIGR03435 family)